MILHGRVNATFICDNFISLYVALEVIRVAAFLLIAYPRSDRSIWVGLRYLFISLLNILVAIKVALNYWAVVLIFIRYRRLL